MLMNNLFGRSFQLKQDCAIDQGTIEIQNDLNCAKVNYNTSADAHGCFDISDRKTLTTLLPLFDTVIIHSWENDQVTNAKIEELMKGHKETKYLRLVYTNSREFRRRGCVKLDPFKFKVTAEYSNNNFQQL